MRKVSGALLTVLVGLSGFLTSTDGFAKSLTGQGFADAAPKVLGVKLRLNLPGLMQRNQERAAADAAAAPAKTGVPPVISPPPLPGGNPPANNPPSNSGTTKSGGETPSLGMPTAKVESKDGSPNGVGEGDAAQAAKDERAIEILREVTATDSKIDQMLRLTGKGAKHLGGEVASTAITIWLLAGVQVLAAQAEEAQLKGETLSTEKMVENMKVLFEHILTSDSLQAGFLGGVASGYSVKFATAIFKFAMPGFSQIIAQSASRSILVNLLATGSTSLFVNVGWTVTSALVDEARLLFLADAQFSESERQKNYEASENMWRLIHIVHFGGLMDVSKEERERAKFVLPQLFRNMGLILFNNPDLRRNWIYNSWRNGIVTGEFVTLVTSMLAGGMIGTALGFAPGFLVGLGFGLVGGVIATEIPQPVKDQLTLGLKEYRELWNQGGSWINEKRLEAAVSNNSLDDVREILHSRLRRRQLKINPYLEALFLLQIRADNLENEIVLASQTIRVQQERATREGTQRALFMRKFIDEAASMATGSSVVLRPFFGLVGVNNGGSLETIVQKKTVALAYYRYMQEAYVSLVPQAYQPELRLVYDLRESARGEVEEALATEYDHLETVDRFLQLALTGFAVPEGLRSDLAFEQRVWAQFPMLLKLKATPKAGAQLLASALLAGADAQAKDPKSKEFRALQKKIFVSLLRIQARKFLQKWAGTGFSERDITGAVDETQVDRSKTLQNLIQGSKTRSNLKGPALPPAGPSHFGDDDVVLPVFKSGEKIEWDVGAP